MLDDAELTDVFFLDPDQGWAVGDRGVILHTEDGGRHWQVQRVGGRLQIRVGALYRRPHRLGGWGLDPPLHASHQLRRSAHAGRWTQLDATCRISLCPP